MSAGEIDEAAVRQAFDRLTFVLAGERVGVAMPAIQDMLVASICVCHETPASAVAFSRLVQRDIEASIIKLFDHYHGQREHRGGGRA